MYHFTDRKNIIWHRLTPGNERHFSAALGAGELETVGQTND